MAKRTRARRSFYTCLVRLLSEELRLKELDHDSHPRDERHLHYPSTAACRRSIHSSSVGRVPGTSRTISARLQTPGVISLRLSAGANAAGSACDTATFVAVWYFTSFAIVGNYKPSRSPALVRPEAKPLWLSLEKDTEVLVLLCDSSSSFHGIKISVLVY